jgi:nicotinamidase-related amidase
MHSGAGKIDGTSEARMRASDVKHKSSQVILFIDLINHFEFPDGQKLLKRALAMAPNLIRLKNRARRAGVPVVYVNDNFGQWRSERLKLIAHCLRPESAGRAFVRQIAPTDADYFVLKPMHSAFYQTPLDVVTLFRGLDADPLWDFN